MASQLEALRARGNLIEQTLDTITLAAATQQPVAFIFDTGGFIELYQKNSCILPKAPIAAEYVTTKAVVDELHLRKNFKILGSIYGMQQCARNPMEMHLEIVDHSPSRRDLEMFAYGLKRGSYDGNSRLGTADLSLLSLAEDLKSALYPVIITPDTDIPNILNGIRTKMIGYLPAHRFYALHEQHYELPLQPTGDSTKK